MYPNRNSKVKWSEKSNKPNNVKFQKLNNNKLFELQVLIEVLECYLLRR